MAAELVALPVDLIVTWGTPAALAAKQATRTVPVVMGAIGDPVSVGGRHLAVFPQRAPAIGVFALEQMALARAAAHDFSGAGDLEALGHGFSRFDSLGSSHK